MILRLPSSAARLSLVVAAFLLAVALSYFSIRNALADYDSSLGTLQGFQQATRLEPRDPRNWYLLGRYSQYNLEDFDSQRAIAAYRTSLALDPRSAATWLDLATAYELDGDRPAARDAFLQAKRVYPLSAEVAWRYGNFLLRLDEFPQAFSEIRHAVSLDPKRGGEAFSRCWRVDPDVNEILDKVLPPDRDAYFAVLTELTSTSNVDSALVVWDRLVALHPRMQLSEVSTLTDMLLRRQRAAAARRVWDQAVTLSGTPLPPNPPGSVLWDGGFESGIRGPGFAWFFGASPGGVQAGFDSRRKHSGNQSLSLGFDGKHNVQFANVCTSAVVVPGVRYTLSAWLRTQTLTTDQGVRIELSWIENSARATLHTPDLHGTEPWTQVRVPFTPGSGVRQVYVCVVRYPSDKFENHIQGVAWVDDVALVPVSAAASNP